MHVLCSCFLLGSETKGVNAIVAGKIFVHTVFSIIL